MKATLKNIKILSKIKTNNIVITVTNITDKYIIGFHIHKGKTHEVQINKKNFSNPHYMNSYELILDEDNKDLIKTRKETSFLRVRNLLADELILNLKLQSEYEFLKVSFENSQLEREFIKLDSRFKNEKHYNKIKN